MRLQKNVGVHVECVNSQHSASWTRNRVHKSFWSQKIDVSVVNHLQPPYRSGAPGRTEDTYLGLVPCPACRAAPGLDISRWGWEEQENSHTNVVTQRKHHKKGEIKKIKRNKDANCTTPKKSFRKYVDINIHTVRTKYGRGKLRGKIYHKEKYFDF